MKKRAIWENTVIAESEDLVHVEGNYYFPRKDVKEEYLQGSDTNTRCPWKGQASYYSLVVGGKTNPDAAWYYPEPFEAAKSIKDRIAFWKGVVVEDA